MRPRHRLCIARTRWSSALRIAVPFFGSAAINFPFSAAIASLLPCALIWSSPTVVTTPIWGLNISNCFSNEISSPSPPTVNSCTQKLYSRLVSNIDCITPLKVLELSLLLWPLYWLESTAAIISLVVVLPQLPVTPIKTTLRSLSL